MKFLVLSCSVFRAEIESLRSESPHELCIEYLELGEHARPQSLKTHLQESIDAAVDVDAVLLCYGLCGTATVGLRAGNCPLVIIRSHDCGGILLGSRRRFEELFKDMPSTPFASIGFCASGDYYFSDGELVLGDSYAELVRVYGEDNARYIYEAMHPKLDGALQPIYYIHTLPSPQSLEQCRTKAVEEGREVIEVPGSLRLLKALLAGDWNDDEFQILAPGERLRMVGDWERIMAAEA